jgi:mono/diheme cytochrome c family protein
VAVTATYSSISKSILTPACVSCHGGSGGYSFDSYANTLKAVTAGKPSSSPLFTSVSTGRMPRGGSALSAAHQQALSDWITAGALNN